MKYTLNQIRQYVCKTAWGLVKNFGYKLAEAMKHAWMVIKLWVKLHMSDSVEFTYKKMDGTIRQAAGTLRSDIIPAVKNSMRKKRAGIQVYFDLDKNEWRSFDVRNLISFAV